MTNTVPLIRSFPYVVRVEERKKSAYVEGSGIGKEAQFKDESLGWYAVLDNHHAFFIGFDKPDLRQGDTVLMTIERVKVIGEQR